MINLKYLQKLFFLLVMGFSLSIICACGDDEEDEPVQNPNEEITNSTDSIPNDNVVDGGLRVNGHEAIDLGLPSGILWASCNIGASSMEIQGEHYAWGELEKKDSYTEANYKFYDSFNKKYSYIGTDISETQYDVAQMKYGENWRIPSKDEFDELLEYCTWEWVQLDGWKSGALFTGPNGNSIFLPGAGCDGKGLNSYGWGYYWTSTLENDNSLSDAYFLSLTASEAYITSHFGSGRYHGFSIRPVTGGKLVVDEPSNEKVIKAEAIDLGLSVKWASHNIGASSPEEFGEYYSWGETETKDNYCYSTYKWGVSNYMTKYATHSSYGNVDKKIILEESDDVAHVKWGDNWRMPTYQEFDELMNKCTWAKSVQNNVEGYLVSASNGNSIFLPLSGYYDREEYIGRDEALGYYYGVYWSSSLDYLDGRCRGAFVLQLTSRAKGQNSYPRIYGLSVRPVCE